MNEYNVFISRSFDECDRELLDHVAGFCRSTGYRPVATERPTHALPIEKVRDAITEARIFLGILTVDHDNPDSKHTRDWIPTEIGMADYARLPILLFVEDGVDFNPAKHITSYDSFSRDDLPTFWKKLVQALVELREDPRVVWGGDTPVGKPYSITVDDIEMEITKNGELHYTRHVKLESKISELKGMRPQNKIITSSKKLGYHSSTFRFSSLSKNCPVRFEELKNEPSEVSYRVAFDEPLRKGETAEFTLVHVSRGSLPLVLEDVRDLMKADYISKKEVARQGHAIKEPTERLTLQVKFPDGYNISECSPELVVTLRDKIGESRDAEIELERVRPHFRIRHNRLDLEVEHPKEDYAYYFVWIPPRVDDLPDDVNLRLE